ncbi:Retrovirus-related Pol polyprotein from transposon TNT 1-94 [Nymphaea thermarum]|nr:Retrovirus-related Pol polyprotein from transposon TNT 1-94 [Nymphaea thermarum]
MDRTFLFLGGLRDEFESIRSQILNCDEIPGIEEVYAWVESEEQRRQVMHIDSSHGNAPSAFVSRASRSAQRPARRCTHCNKLGYSVDFCWDLHPEKRLVRGRLPSSRHSPSVPDSSQTNSSGGNKSKLSSDQLKELQAYISRLSTTPAEDSTSEGAQLPQALVASSDQGNPSLGDWIVDSGATHHMTWDSKLFQEYQLSSGQQHMSMADESSIFVAEKGSLSLLNKYRLHNALHVPNIPVNLLSVSSITKELNCNLIFSADHCSLQDLVMGKKIGIGSVIDGLYRLPVQVASALISPTSGQLSGVEDRCTIMRWHERLGHLPFQLIKKLFPRLFTFVSMDSFACEVCQLAKHVRASYPISLLNKFLVCGALHVPHLPLNLLSVSKITKELNCELIFFANRCVLQDLVTGKRIVIDLVSEGLYRLPICVATALMIAISRTEERRNDCRQLFLYWHERLGHLPFGILKQLFPYLCSNLDMSMISCDVCQFAKHVRASYPISTSRANEVFSLIYSDVWGPLRIHTRQGFQHFITFIDDFSKSTFVYLLKDRSEVPHVIETFIVLVETQYGGSVKTFRTDNARMCANLLKISFEKGGLLMRHPVAIPLHKMGLLRGKIVSYSMSTGPSCFKGIFQNNIGVMLFSLVHI